MQASKVIHSYTRATSKQTGKKLSPQERQAVLEVLLLTFNKGQLGSITKASEILACYKEGKLDEAATLASLAAANFFSLVSKETFLKAFKEEPMPTALEMQDIWQVIRAAVTPLARPLASQENSTLSILASLTDTVKQDISASILEDLAVIKGAHAYKVASIKEAAKAAIQDELVNKGLTKATQAQESSFAKAVKAAREKGKWLDIEEQEALGWAQEQQDEFFDAYMAYSRRTEAFKLADKDESAQEGRPIFNFDML